MQLTRPAALGHKRLEDCHIFSPNSSLVQHNITCKEKERSIANGSHSHSMEIVPFKFFGYSPRGLVKVCCESAEDSKEGTAHPLSCISLGHKVIHVQVLWCCCFIPSKLTVMQFSGRPACTEGIYLGGHKDEDQSGRVGSSDQFFRCTSSCCKKKAFALAREGGSIFENGSSFERHAGKSCRRSSAHEDLDMSCAMIMGC